MTSLDKEKLRGLLIYFIIFTLSLVFMGAFYIASLDKKTKEISNIDKLIVEKENYQKIYPDADFTIANLNNKIKLVEKILPNKIESSLFLSNISNYANYVSVNLIEIKPGEIKEQGKVKSQDFNIVISGDFFPSINFLSKIHNTNPYTIINSGQMYIEDGIIKTNINCTIFALDRLTN